MFLLEVMSLNLSIFRQPAIGEVLRRLAVAGPQQQAGLAERHPIGNAAGNALVNGLNETLNAQLWHRSRR